MSVSPFKTFSAGEVLSASDLNSSFSQIFDNGEDLSWPATKAKDFDGQELILDADADTSITADQDDRIDFRVGGTDRGRWIAAGLMVSGGATGTPDGTLHVHTATAGTVLAGAGADDLVVENSADAGISILTPDANQSNIFFGAPTDNRGSLIRWDHTANLMTIGNDIASAQLRFMSGAFVEAGRFDAAGTLLIGDTVNADMTVGLTINQGVNDNEIIALKSSDVGHAMTSNSEADTFCTLAKSEATSGGLQIRGYKDANGAASGAIQLVGRLGEAAEETDTTSSIGVADLVAQVTDGGTSVGVIANDGNLLSIRNSTTCRLLVKGNGVLHATNITSGSGDLDGLDLAADHEDDIGILRVFERERSQGMGIIMSKWDDAIKANENDLKRVGILSSDGSFYNVQRMNSFIGGAIWQVHTHERETRELVEQLSSRLALAERKLALPKQGEHNGRYSG